MRLDYLCDMQLTFNESHATTKPHGGEKVAIRAGRRPGSRRTSTWLGTLCQPCTPT